jgi:hypothetical protein
MVHMYEPIYENVWGHIFSLLYDFVTCVKPHTCFTYVHICIALYGHICPIYVGLVKYMTISYMVLYEIFTWVAMLHNGLHAIPNEVSHTLLNYLYHVLKGSIC